MALKKEITDQIRELLRQNPGGLSITAIVRQIPINRNTAGRYLENLMVSGQVEMRHFGMAKIYSLAQRVPLVAMLSISSELIMLLDTSRRVIYANGPLLDFLSTTQKDLYGKTIEFTPCITVFDDTFEHLKKRIVNGIAGKEWSGEIVAKNGSMIFACRIAPAVFEEGQRGVSILLENITDRRLAERRIEESEKQFRLLAENTLDVIDRHSVDGTCLYVSPAITPISGFEPRELIGRKAEHFLHPDDMPQMARVMRELNADNPVGQLVYRVRHKDGHYIWAESRFRAIIDEITGQVNEVYGITRDISARVLAEQALRESEDRYRTLVEIAPDAIILHQDGRIIYVNPAARTLLGVSSPEELTSLNVLDIVHPDFRRLVQDNIDKDISGYQTPLIELPIIRRDGTEIIAEGRGARTTIGGRPAVQVTLRDITERKKAEISLRESRKRLIASQRIARLGDIIWDLTTGEVTWSDGIYDLMQYDKTERIDITRVNREIHHPDDLERITAWLEGCISSGADRITPNEYRIIRKDGKVLFVQTEGEIQRVNGKPVRVFVTLQDITERKIGEQALHDSEEKYRSLVEQSLQGLTIIQNGRPVFANPAMLEISGYHYEEYLALSAQEMIRTIHPADRERIRKLMADRLEGRDVPKENEFRILRKDGKVRWVHTYGTLITYNEAPAIQVAYFDITERKQAEDALRESEQRLVAAQRIARFGDITWEPDTGTVTWSDGMYSLLGYDRADVIDMTRVYTENHHPEDRERINAWLNDCISSGSDRIPHNEYRIVRKDGTVLFVYAEGEIQRIEGKPRKVFITLQDITERKLAEQEIRQARDMFRTFIDHSYDAVILHDTKGRVLNVNERMLAMYRLSREEALSSTIADLSDSTYSGETEGGLWKEVLTGRDQFFPWHARRPSDGSIFEVEVYLTRIMIGDRFVILSNVRDMTERHRMEDALRESENRYRTLAEASRDLIFLINRDDRVEYVNSCAAAILGLTADEVIGKKRSSLFPAELAQHQGQALHRVFETGNAVRSEGPMGIAGSLHWFDHYLTPIMDGDSRVASVLGVSRDITDRRRIDEALTESEKRFHDLAELLPQNVWECDINGKVTFANQRSFTMYQLTPEDIERGVYVWQTIHPDDRDRVLKDFAEALKHPPEEFPTHHEFTSVRKDGSTFPVLMYHTPIIMNGRIAGMRGIGIDLTERRQIEEELRESIRAYRTLAENSVDIISRIGPDGTCLYISPAVLWSLGYEPAEVVGHKGSEFLHPDDLPRLLERIRFFESDGADTGTDRFRMRHKDGSYVRFESSIRATRDGETGTIREYTLVFRLIADQDVP